MSSPPKVIIVSLNITFEVKNVQLYYSLLLHIVIALLKCRQKYYLERGDHGTLTLIRTSRSKCNGDPVFSETDAGNQIEY